MQHAMSFRFGRAVSGPGLDPGRIIASAGALAIHVVVLLLLLVPAKLPPLAPDSASARRVCALASVTGATPSTGRESLSTATSFAGPPPSSER